MSPTDHHAYSMFHIDVEIMRRQRPAGERAQDINLGHQAQRPIRLTRIKIPKDMRGKPGSPFPLHRPSLTRPNAASPPTRAAGYGPIFRLGSSRLDVGQPRTAMKGPTSECQPSCQVRRPADLRRAERPRRLCGFSSSQARSAALQQHRTAARGTWPGRPWAIR